MDRKVAFGKKERENFKILYMETCWSVGIIAFCNSNSKSARV